MLLLTFKMTREIHNVPDMRVGYSSSGYMHSIGVPLCNTKEFGLLLSLTQAGAWLNEYSQVSGSQDVPLRNNTQQINPTYLAIRLFI